MHRVIKFNQEAWSKPYIDMNQELKIKAKNDFQKHFLTFDEQCSFSKNHGK